MLKIHKLVEYRHSEPEMGALGECQVEGNEMAKRKRQKEAFLEQQPYDNALKSLLEGQEAQILPHFLPRELIL